MVCWLGLLQNKAEGKGGLLSPGLHVQLQAKYTGNINQDEAQPRTPSSQCMDNDAEQSGVCAALAPWQKQYKLKQLQRACPFNAA